PAAAPAGVRRGDLPGGLRVRPGAAERAARLSPAIVHTPDGVRHRPGLGKPVFLFRADDPAALDPHDPEPEELRKLPSHYRDDLRALDQVRQSFKTKDERLAQLQKLELPPPSPRKPINLPYKTLGTLFKGCEGFLCELRTKLGAGPGRAVGVLAA